MLGLDYGGKTAVMGLHSITCHGNAPASTRGPVGGPLSLGMVRDVRMCSAWRGLRKALSALSLDGGR